MKSFVSLIGFYSAITTVILTLITFSLACIAVPIAGPYCPFQETEEDGRRCIEYPYTPHIQDQFPIDYLWMFLAIPQTASYLILVCSALAWTSPEDGNKRVFGTIATAFATIGASILLADYYVQLSIVMPNVLHGEHGNGLALLTMYNGRGVFIALEEIGFLSLSVSLLALSPLFPGTTLSRLLAAPFVLAVGALLYINATHGWERSYRFEVAIIVIDWLAFIVCGTMMGRVFLQDALRDAEKKAR